MFDRVHRRVPRLPDGAKQQCKDCEQWKVVHHDTEKSAFYRQARGTYYHRCKGCKRKMVRRAQVKKATTKPPIGPRRYVWDEPVAFSF